MGIPELIFAVLLIAGVILVLAAVIRGRRRGWGKMFLYPVSRSSKGIPEGNAGKRTPPGKR